MQYFWKKMLIILRHSVVSLEYHLDGHQTPSLGSKWGLAGFDFTLVWMIVFREHC